MSTAARFSACVLPVTVRQSPWSRPRSSSSFITTGTPPTRSRSLITYLPAGRTSTRCGVSPGDPIEVVELQIHLRLARDRQAGGARRSSIRRGPSRSVIAFSNASFVRMSRGSGPPPVTSSAARIPLSRANTSAPVVDGGRGRGARQREPDRLADGRHRVGGVHARARPGGGARRPLDAAELGLVDRALRVRADGLEHVLDRDVAARRRYPGGSCRRRGRPTAGSAGPSPSSSRARTCRSRRSRRARRTVPRASRARRSPRSGRGSSATPSSPRGPSRSRRRRRSCRTRREPTLPGARPPSRARRACRGGSCRASPRSTTTPRRPAAWRSRPRRTRRRGASPEPAPGAAPR